MTTFARIKLVFFLLILFFLDQTPFFNVGLKLELTFLGLIFANFYFSGEFAFLVNTLAAFFVSLFSSRGFLIHWLFFMVVFLAMKYFFRHFPKNRLFHFLISAFSILIYVFLNAVFYNSPLKEGLSFFFRCLVVYLVLEPMAKKWIFDF